MMNKWFECKVRYEKIVDGKSKKVTEPYLIEAFSYTEAEARVIEELSMYISGEFIISSIKQSRIAELFPSEYGDRWYACKIGIILIDESKGTEKKTIINILVQASSVLEAWKLLEENMKGSVSDYVVVSIGESSILDIFPYKTKDKQINNNENKAIDEE